ncbi:helix-turn-helix domain-containing protein [Duganella radicis]|uniref:Helix-turn-helix domain-containing protein n=1 Tax=Duganella radicis TaxID=551988 RepID=A0A6L6PBC1_9BURK|nr:helix-turn-helix domain-containing protein [Duganella radicis]MTV36264.1 helix-turn-helix domain-containing protein [Duganella radicis]
MPKPETTTMSMQELDRLKTVQAVVAGQIKASAAAARLNITRRQINRLIQRYLDAGAAGLVSRKLGKPSNFQLAPGIAASALAIIRERYQDFGPTLAMVIWPWTFSSRCSVS